MALPTPTGRRPCLSAMLAQLRPPTLFQQPGLQLNCTS